MRRRQSGFTLFELVVVIILVAVLGGVALDRFYLYQEMAEAESAKRDLSMLKTALNIRSAELISANRWDELQRLPQQNPFDLLEERPANYGGLWSGEERPGHWYFDPGARTVTYVPSRREAFSAPGGERYPRFVVTGLNSSGQAVSGPGVAYVNLRPAGIYRWFDRPLR